MATKNCGGRDGEPQLVGALRDLLDAEERDTITKTKSHYWVIHHIIDVAIAREFTNASCPRSTTPFFFSTREMT